MPRGKQVAIALIAVALLGGGFAVWGWNAWGPQQPTLERCMGYPLPPGCKVIAHAGAMYYFNGERYFVVNMSAAAYETFCGTNGLKQRDDVTRSWHKIMRAPPGIQWLLAVPDPSLIRVDDTAGVFKFAVWENGVAYVRISVP